MNSDHATYTENLTLPVEGLGREANRLKIQGIELMSIESAHKQHLRLQRAQAEMTAFTNFVFDSLDNLPAAA